MISMAVIPRSASRFNSAEPAAARKVPSGVKVPMCNSQNTISSNGRGGASVALLRKHAGSRRMDQPSTPSCCCSDAGSANGVPVVEKA